MPGDPAIIEACGAAGRALSASRGAAIEPEFYIIDIRPEWRRHRYLTLWRPENAGYCWSLPWAGRYSLVQVIEGGSYYAKREYQKENWIRFPVPCEVADRLAVEQPRPGDIDGNVGPVLRNLAPVRRKLLAAARFQASAKAAETANGPVIRA